MPRRMYGQAGDGRIQFLMPKRLLHVCIFRWRRRTGTMKIGASTLWERAMQEESIVRMPSQSINDRILARVAKADFRRMEGASVKMRTEFMSPEGKRLFVRLFNSLQLQMHFISIIARTRLPLEEIEQAEQQLRLQMEGARQRLDQAFDQAEACFREHGISAVATYDAEPLVLHVGVMSAMGRRYLEVLGRLDRLMPLLQTLEIHEAMSSRDVDLERAQLKREVRAIPARARVLANTLRERFSREREMVQPSAASAQERLTGTDEALDTKAPVTR